MEEEFQATKLATRLGVAPRGSVTAEEFHEWALTLWRRMDRDHSGIMSREELDCEEFQEVLKSVIAPETRNSMATQSVTYARSSANVKQAINFCLRKADNNSDGTLTFEEFKAFLRVLRNSNTPKNSANLIFALFDIDGTQTLEKEEFRELYRYYLGHNPPALEFNREWALLDWRGRGYVTREDYVRWLRESPNPLFQQHAPPVDDDGPEATELAAAPAAATTAPLSFVSKRSLTPKITQRYSVGLPALRPSVRETRPPWNEEFAWKDPSARNAAVPARLRQYFFRAASEPELTRFYGTHARFKKEYETMLKPVPKRQGKSRPPHNWMTAPPATP